MSSIDIETEVSAAFENYLYDWDYRTQLLIGGFGSGKSHVNALKLIIKAYSEKRDMMVIRKTYKSHRNSTFKLFKKILKSMNLLETNPRAFSHDYKVIAKESPMKLIFPTGSTIIFEGTDDIENMKSIDDVTIIWFEECSQLTLKIFMNLRGRARSPGKDSYFLLSTNPVSMENWVYTTFFIKDESDIRNKGKTKEELIVVEPEEFYTKKTLVRKGVYYHHSTVDDNPYMSTSYIKDLEEIQDYDRQLYETARNGRFGTTDKIVLPQFRVANSHERLIAEVSKIDERYHFTGFDFGFEESYNAVVRMAVDKEKQYLYIYDCLYENHVTDDIFITRPLMQKIMKHQKYCDENGIRFNPVVGDSSSPKDIAYYSQQGMYIRACLNRGMVPNASGTRIANTKKIKRFKRIICSPNCQDVIKELKYLTYKVDKNDKVCYDQFNRDPHSKLQLNWSV